MDDLFSMAGQDLAVGKPLAEKARPEKLTDFVGQEKWIGQGRLLADFLASDHLPSLVLWGPPGCGKTSFANLVSKATKSTFISRSAIDTGAKELKEEGEKAKERLHRFSEKTILFIDEIHRLNRAQQDCLLPYLEKGYLTLIGATTENPSFELNSALLSRCQVIVFEGLKQADLEKILSRALVLLDPELSWSSLAAAPLKDRLIGAAAGDGRRVLNLLENVYEYYVSKGRQALPESAIDEALQFVPARYDKDRDQHYDTISAFIKSIRGSDPDAALFYLARMLKGGEDPLFIARRLVILASEDIGNADHRALQVAVAVKDAVDFIGMPEAAISLAQAVTFLAASPKSNRSYMGLKKAQALADKFPHVEIPKSVRNAPTKLMKALGYGEDYKYAHDSDTGVTNQQFLPDEIKDVRLYEPTERGHEKILKGYLNWVRSQKSPEKN